MGPSKRSITLRLAVAFKIHCHPLNGFPPRELSPKKRAPKFISEKPSVGFRDLKWGVTISYVSQEENFNSNFEKSWMIQKT